MSDFTRPEKVVKDWKDIFPSEPQKPAVKRSGALSSRPAVAAQHPKDDDPWRVGYQHSRRNVERLANGASVAGFVRDYTLGSNGYGESYASQSEYTTPTTSTPTVPGVFEVSHVSDNIFRVQAGTCEGQLIATQTINVGSARPVTILAYPQYHLDIYNSEFVYASNVKTGANAPVLVSSTSIFSDVTTGITSAGTQARALIAYINSSNVISQITTGNIIGTFRNTGLNGTMGGSFNKNA